MNGTKLSGKKSSAYFTNTSSAVSPSSFRVGSSVQRACSAKPHSRNTSLSSTAFLSSQPLQNSRAFQNKFGSSVPLPRLRSASPLPSARHEICKRGADGGNRKDECQIRVRRDEGSAVEKKNGKGQSHKKAVLASVSATSSSNSSHSRSSLCNKLGEPFHVGNSNQKKGRQLSPLRRVVEDPNSAMSSCCYSSRLASCFPPQENPCFPYQSEETVFPGFRTLSSAEDQFPHTRNLLSSPSNITQSSGACLSRASLQRQSHCDTLDILRYRHEQSGTFRALNEKCASPHSVVPSTWARAETQALLGSEMLDDRSKNNYSEEIVREKKDQVTDSSKTSRRPSPFNHREDTDKGKQEYDESKFEDATRSLRAEIEVEKQKLFLLNKTSSASVSRAPNCKSTSPSSWSHPYLSSRASVDEGLRNKSEMKEEEESTSIVENKTRLKSFFNSCNRQQGIKNDIKAGYIMEPREAQLSHTIRNCQTERLDNSKCSEEGEDTKGSEMEGNDYNNFLRERQRHEPFVTVMDEKESSWNSWRLYNCGLRKAGANQALDMPRLPPVKEEADGDVSMSGENIYCRSSIKQENGYERSSSSMSICRTSEETSARENSNGFAEYRHSSYDSEEEEGETETRIPGRRQLPDHQRLSDAEQLSTWHSFSSNSDGYKERNSDTYMDVDSSPSRFFNNNSASNFQATPKPPPRASTDMSGHGNSAGGSTVTNMNQNLNRGRASQRSPYISPVQPVCAERSSTGSFATDDSDFMHRRHFCNDDHSLFRARQSISCSSFQPNSTRPRRKATLLRHNSEGLENEQQTGEETEKSTGKKREEAEGRDHFFVGSSRSSCGQTGNNSVNEKMEEEICHEGAYTSFERHARISNEAERPLDGADDRRSSDKVQTLHEFCMETDSQLREQPYANNRHRNEVASMEENSQSNQKSNSTLSTAATTSSSLPNLNGTNRSGRSEQQQFIGVGNSGYEEDGAGEKQRNEGVRIEKDERTQDAARKSPAGSLQSSVAMPKWMSGSGNRTFNRSVDSSRGRSGQSPWKESNGKKTNNVANDTDKRNKMDELYTLDRCGLDEVSASVGISPAASVHSSPPDLSLLPLGVIAEPAPPMPHRVFSASVAPTDSHGCGPISLSPTSHRFRKKLGKEKIETKGAFSPSRYKQRYERSSIGDEQVEICSEDNTCVTSFCHEHQNARNKSDENVEEKGKCDDGYQMVRYNSASHDNKQQHNKYASFSPSSATDDNNNLDMQSDKENLNANGSNYSNIINQRRSMCSNRKEGIAKAAYAQSLSAASPPSFSRNSFSTQNACMNDKSSLNNNNMEFNTFSKTLSNNAHIAALRHDSSSYRNKGEYANEESPVLNSHAAQVEMQQTKSLNYYCQKQVYNTSEVGSTSSCVAGGGDVMRRKKLPPARLLKILSNTEEKTYTQGNSDELTFEKCGGNQMKQHAIAQPSPSPTGTVRISPSATIRSVQHTESMSSCATRATFYKKVNEIKSPGGANMDVEEWTPTASLPTPVGGKQLEEGKGRKAASEEDKENMPSKASSSSFILKGGGQGRLGGEHDYTSMCLKDGICRCKTMTITDSKNNITEGSNKLKTFQYSKNGVSASSSPCSLSSYYPPFLFPNGYAKIRVNEEGNLVLKRCVECNGWPELLMLHEKQPDDPTERILSPNGNWLSFKPLIFHAFLPLPLPNNS